MSGFWRRSNPRILMEDILIRMHPDMLPRTTVGDTRLRNSLNIRASRRAYPEYCMISWFGKGLDGGRLKHTARDETLQMLTPQQIESRRHPRSWRSECKSALERWVTVRQGT